jgi:hypothetical protein
VHNPEWADDNKGKKTSITLLFFFIAGLRKLVVDILHGFLVAGQHDLIIA